MAFQCIYRCSDERGENWDGEEGSGISEGEERANIAWSLVCRALRFVWRVEGRLKGKVGRFVEVYRRRGLKVNEGKSKVRKRKHCSVVQVLAEIASSYQRSTILSNYDTEQQILNTITEGQCKTKKTKYTTCRTLRKKTSPHGTKKCTDG